MWTALRCGQPAGHRLPLSSPLIPPVE
ncbi:unnamed protein product [Spirodela intermedia]|uniref:Uncharacterized protein n=1 Tax=Spirodela intermedia TaxID=51605 RepID=A0A7I8LM14_SPIIN|nr:unnamed protein product [Spirodela intermedia]